MNKKELKARCKELGIATEGLTTNALLEEAIAKREAELEAEKAATTSEDKPGGSDDTNTESEEVIAEVSETENSTEESGEKKEEEQEAERLVYEDKRNRKWGFKESAPKTLNIDGHPMSQEEIFDNEDVISELVYGNSSFLIQIHE